MIFLIVIFFGVFVLFFVGVLLNKRPMKFKVGDLIGRSDRESWEYADLYYVKDVGKYHYRLVRVDNYGVSRTDDFEFIHRYYKLYSRTKEPINWDKLK